MKIYSLKKVKKQSALLQERIAATSSHPNDAIEINAKVRVGVCLDMSASMREAIRNGIAGDVVKKTIMMGLLLDSETKVDVFGFGNHAELLGTVEASDVDAFCESLKTAPTMGDTKYSNAIHTVVDFYEQNNSDIPAYVAFITDGEALDKGRATRVMKEMSSSSIFFQFIGIGEDDEPVPAVINNDKSSLSKTGRLKSFFHLLIGKEQEEQVCFTNKGIFRKFAFIKNMLNEDSFNNVGFFSIENQGDFQNKLTVSLMIIRYIGWSRTRQAL